MVVANLAWNSSFVHITFHYSISINAFDPIMFLRAICASLINALATSIAHLMLTLNCLAINIKPITISSPPTMA